mmetsp:Transcript_55430/g.152711  ORF Transcript_55430/g.152711 Transcript_55430/m.152711 type:complete len:91 (-) Transcript_55430:250-522(-)
MARESVHAERQERSDEIKTPRNQGHSLSSSSAHEELDVQRERERERERERGRAGCEAPREILFLPPTNPNENTLHTREMGYIHACAYLRT